LTTVLPRIVNDIVNMTDFSFSESVSDMPCFPFVARSVDVDFVAIGVIEVLAPIDIPSRDCRDVKRPGAACDAMRLVKFGIPWAQGDNRPGYGADQLPACQNSKCMKAIAKQTGGEAMVHG